METFNNKFRVKTCTKSRTPTFRRPTPPTNSWRLFLLIIFFLSMVTILNVVNCGSVSVSDSDNNLYHQDKKLLASPSKVGVSNLQISKSNVGAKTSVATTQSSSLISPVRGHYGSSGQGQFLISFLAGFLLFLFMMAFVTMITKYYFKTNYSTLLGLDEDDDNEDLTDNDNNDDNDDDFDATFESVFGRDNEEEDGQRLNKPGVSTKLIGVQTRSGTRYDSFDRRNVDANKSYDHHSMSASPLIASPKTVIASIHDQRPSKIVSFASPTASTPQRPSASMSASSVLFDTSINQQRRHLYTNNFDERLLCQRPLLLSTSSSSASSSSSLRGTNTDNNDLIAKECTTNLEQQLPLITDNNYKRSVIDAKFGVRTPGAKFPPSFTNLVQNSSVKPDHGQDKHVCGIVASVSASDSKRDNKKFKTLQVSIKNAPKDGKCGNKNDETHL